LFVEEDYLTGDNKWYCENCKEYQDATKRTDLWVLPPILIIHLKRFRCPKFGKEGQKNVTMLQYPLTDWDLSKIVKNSGGGAYKYDLYAVSNHCGGLTSGHYSSYALNRFDDEWYSFNDAKYEKIDPHSTFEFSSSPYLLFYNRVPSEEVSSSGSSRLQVHRQCHSRPDLWPHTEVHEGHFREFQRSHGHHDVNPEIPECKQPDASPLHRGVPESSLPESSIDECNEVKKKRFQEFLDNHKQNLTTLHSSCSKQFHSKLPECRVQMNLDICVEA
jgi:Ubiquitin carboxyl-terminal hydrolase